MTDQDARQIAGIVGTNLKVWRARNDVTQADLAQRMKISQSHFSRIEQGVKCPSLRTLVRLSREIGMPLSELISANGC